MTVYTNNLPARVNRTWEMVRQFSNQERLLLAKALLDSVIAPVLTEKSAEGSDEEADWQHLSLTAFAADWDNADDAIYDNWREHYNV